MSKFFSIPSTLSHHGIFISALGAFVSILLVVVVSGSMLSGIGLPVIVASMGASAIILFAVPSSPMARPWPLVGGHIIAATIGVACYQWVPGMAFAAPLAVTLSIIAMLYLRCLHPPGGAAALITVIGGDEIHALGFQFVLTPIALNVTIMLFIWLLFMRVHEQLLAMMASRLKHDTWWDVVPAKKIDVHPPFEENDLSNALHEMDTYIDVSHEDLNKIYSLALLNYHTRHFGDATCGDIMTNHHISVEYGTPLGEVWEYMKQHMLRGIPVVSPARHVIGVITTSDFLKHASQFDGTTEQLRLQQLITPSTGLTSNKPEVAGQIMTANVVTSQVSDKITAVVYRFRRHNIHHMPVVDENNKLQGMISSADLQLTKVY